MKRNTDLLYMLGGLILIAYPSYKLMVAYSTGVIQVRKRITASIEHEPFLFWVGVVAAVIFVIAGVLMIGTVVRRKLGK